MGLNDIRLTNTALAALYPKTLVENSVFHSEKSNIPASAESNTPATSTIAADEEILADTITAKKIDTPKAWKQLGDNNKNILIAVSYSQFPYLPDEELNFLTAILSACHLTIGDVAIINHHNYTDTSYTEILKHYSSRTVLLFGIEPHTFGLPVSFPEFQVQTFNNHKYLFAPSLQECRNDKLQKSKLWLCLRSIFGIQ